VKLVLRNLRKLSPNYFFKLLSAGTGVQRESLEAQEGSFALSYPLSHANVERRRACGNTRRR
jgi:hypothetical protein